MHRGFITIDTIGVVRATSSDGKNLTPVGARASALLAVVALSPRKTAARRWLETLFWGDRGEQQASGSLRQALSAIRRSLGDYSHVLVTDRLQVSLDPLAARVDVLDSPAHALAELSRGRDLLEGIDIPSEPFEDWLRMERARLGRVVQQASLDQSITTAVEAEIASKPADADPGRLLFSANGQLNTLSGTRDKPRLLTETQSPGLGLDAFIAEAIRSQLARTASEHAHLAVVALDGKSTRAVLSAGARCMIRVVQNGKRMLALARLTREPSGELFWSRQIAFDAHDEAATIDAAAALSLEATEAVVACERSASDPAIANALASSALRHVFSFDPERLKQADALLAKAQMMDPLAPRPALRALAKAFLAVERSTGELGDLRDEVHGLIHDALDLDPANPLALSFIADVQDLVFGDPTTALSYAERALRLDPGTGYAYASLGGLELRRGRKTEALTAAARAKRQLENTSLQVFSLMRFCLAAMNNGKFDAALSAAEQASYLAPTSRPPLRHLYVLRLRAGNIEGARAALTMLRKLEPDFSLLRIREDPEFPAATIRAVGLDKLTDVEI